MNKKRGFSILELLMTCVILVVVCIATPMIVLKKNIKKPVGETKARTACICSADANFEQTENCFRESSSDGHIVCTFKPPTAKFEFYTVDIIGGGGGALGDSKNYGGGAGDGRTIVFPGLNGKLCMKLGYGGDSGRNGEDTIVVQLPVDSATDCKSLGFEGEEENQIAFIARGGLTNSETFDSSADEEGSTKKSEGQASSIDSRFGHGLPAGSNGSIAKTKQYTGAVLIQW